MVINSKLLKFIGAIYILFLAGVICLADLKGTQYLLAFVGNFPYGDKIGHFMLMGIFSLLLNLVLGCRKFHKIMLGSLTVLLLVTAEECSQIFIEGRTFDFSDLIFDYAGIFIFGEIALLIFRRFAKD